MSSGGSADLPFPLPALPPSAEEALRHPYCAQFHNPHDEPVALATITIPIDDNTKVGIGLAGEERRRPAAVSAASSRPWPQLARLACNLPVPRTPPCRTRLTTPRWPAPCLLQYTISEYRDRLYLEIVKRKKELRRAQKEREAARAASRSKSRSSTAAAAAYGGSSYAASAHTHAAAYVRH